MLKIGSYDASGSFWLTPDAIAKGYAAYRVSHAHLVCVTLKRVSLGRFRYSNSANGVIGRIAVDEGAFYDTEA
jgi:hypothetical protein